MKVINLMENISDSVRVKKGQKTKVVDLETLL